MQSEALLVPQFTSLESKTYPKPNESYGQNRIFLSFLKKFKGIAMKFKKNYMIASIWKPKLWKFCAAFNNESLASLQVFHQEDFRYVSDVGSYFCH